MSKPLFCTEAMVKECMAEFEERLREMKFFSGKLKYEVDYTYPDKEVATVVFSRIAYEKQQRLIQEFSSEVAWNGIVRRDAENPTKFHIEDIIIFPQKVTGATVTPDQAEYNIWSMSLPQEQLDNCRYHGHSHVNMGTSPSGTDDKCQADMLDKLDGAGYTPEERLKFLERVAGRNFYIFMIWNKRGDHHARVYDMDNNTFYDTSEVTIEVEGIDPMEEFIKEAKEKVKNYTYTPPVQSANKQSAAVLSKGKGASAPALPAKDDDDAHRRRPIGYDYYDDYYDDYRLPYSHPRM